LPEARESAELPKKFRPLSLERGKRPAEAVLTNQAA
jgi:hypothetical protein